MPPVIKTGVFTSDGDLWQPSRGEMKFLRDNGIVTTRRGRNGVAQPLVNEPSIIDRIVEILRTTAVIQSVDEIAENGVTVAQFVQRDLGVSVDFVSEECIAWIEKVASKLLSTSMAGKVQQALAPESDDDPRFMLVMKSVRRNRRDEAGELLLDLDNAPVRAYAITTSVDVVDSLTLNPLRDQKVKAAARDSGRAAAMTSRMPDLAPYVIADAQHAAAIAARNVDQVAETVLEGLPDAQRRAVLAQVEALVVERAALSTGSQSGE